MVLLNGFSLQILAKQNGRFHVASEQRQPGGAYIVPLAHETEYELQLANYNDTEADAEVYIDGELVIIVKLWAGETMTIEHGDIDYRKFVFVKEKSQIAREAGVQPFVFDNGLIKVVFKLRKKPMYEALRHRPIYEAVAGSAMAAPSVGARMAAPSLAMRQPAAPAASAQSYEAGATVLGNVSNQRFTEALPIPPDEIASETTIMLRLVAGSSGCQVCPRKYSTQVPSYPGFVRDDYYAPR